MLAELAAANAAFAVIKSAVQNSGDLVKAGSAITNFVAAKEELTRRKNKKTGKGIPVSDLEEFLALEQIRQKEEELKQFMIYTGRPGLWSDWQKFLAEARKSRRVQEELARKKREELIELIGVVSLGLVLLAGLVGFFWWVLVLQGRV